MNEIILPRREGAEFFGGRAAAVPREIMTDVVNIVEAVREGREGALRDYVERFQEGGADESLFIPRDSLSSWLARLGAADRIRLERIAERIRAFAKAQRDALSEIALEVPGGRVGQNVSPMAAAGCYAPGGRYPLPSSVLMTAIPARVAGVKSIWLASPRPTPITLAAAAVAEVDGVLCAGGAHAVAALAFGVGPLPRSDIIVGPGNLYVTAAKHYLAGSVAIDMLAGPSELVILADGCANPAWVAADLLAQAEHDPQALPILITVDPALVAAVETELRIQLSDLPTAEIARAALGRGGVILCQDLSEAARISEGIAPEHLQLSVKDPDLWIPRLKDYGALFVGEGSAEVFGDYGVGPNHVLPTSGTARSRGGLSVLDFLRTRTWIRLDEPAPPAGLVEDSAWLARAEGLEAHARAAEARLR